MSLLELYIKKNANFNAQEMLRDDKDNTYLFEFTRNFHTLHKFEEGFRTFKKICDMTEAEKQAYLKDGSAPAKSFMNNMIRTKLF